MAKTPVSLRLPSDLVGKLDEEAEKKRRTRTLIVVEMLEARYPETFTDTNKTKSKKKAGQR